MKRILTLVCAPALLLAALAAPARAAYDPATDYMAAMCEAVAAGDWAAGAAARVASLLMPRDARPHNGGVRGCFQPLGRRRRRAHVLVLG